MSDLTDWLTTLPARMKSNALQYAISMAIGIAITTSYFLGNVAHYTAIVLDEYYCNVDKERREAFREAIANESTEGNRLVAYCAKDDQ